MAATTIVVLRKRRALILRATLASAACSMAPRQSVPTRWWPCRKADLLLNIRPPVRRLWPWNWERPAVRPQAALLPIAGITGLSPERQLAGILQALLYLATAEETSSY